MASTAQRAVTGVSRERWGQFGRALQDWREDVLGYHTRAGFAEDRDINIRLVQDLEKNYRPGTFTKFALQDAADAYMITYESVLAFLRGNADRLYPVQAAPPGPETPASRSELERRPPIADPAREDADRPYADGIYADWRHWSARYAREHPDVRPEDIPEPDGGQLFAPGSAYADAWDSTAGRMETRNRVWLVADMQRRAADRGGDRSGKAAGSLPAR